MEGKTMLLLLMLVLVPLFSLGFLNVLHVKHPRPVAGSRKIGSPTRLLIVLGSGGHTAEMFAMLRNLDVQKYTHRSYVVSSGDSFSAEKATAFEAMINPEGAKRLQAVTGMHPRHRPYVNYDIVTVPRARRIHQRLLTTPFSALKCLYQSVLVLHGHQVWPPIPCADSQHPDDPVYPDLILLNGPATAVIVVLAVNIVRFLWLPGSGGKLRTVYVESWARVKRLSLSGRLLVRIVDRFIVQWESLITATAGKGEFLGSLVE